MESQKDSHTCKFTAWPCAKGNKAFDRGHCFPKQGEGWTQEMGYPANGQPFGNFYLATRQEAPFCGKYYSILQIIITGAAANKF